MIVTDIHTHIIPSVDDGSRSLAESVELIESTVAQGVGVIVATPHSWGIDNCGFDHMLSRFKDLREAVRARQIPVQLYLGCEMLVFADTIDDCIRKLNDGRYPTLAGSYFVLTEFDPYEIRNNMEYCLEKIIAAGYVPVIAHAERYRRITISDIRALKDLGAMIQINAYSIANETNVQTRQLANDCLAVQLVDFIGSDAHRLDHRPPMIQEGVAALMQRYTADYAKKVTMMNPLLLFR